MNYTMVDSDYKKPLEKREGFIKFVRVNNLYRFIHGLLYHSHLVKEGEKPQSAGTIFLFDDHWRIEDWHSSTLNIQCTEEDIENLKQIFDVPYLDNY